MKTINLSRFSCTLALILVLLAVPWTGAAAHPCAEGDPGLAEIPSLGAGEFVSCADQTQVPTGECAALVALYDATDGPNWTDSTGWVQTDEPCGWNGVFCEGGHVAHIRLNDNGLDGTIPVALTDLPALIGLHLSRNALVGSIPPELADLSALGLLDLSHNGFTGGIPAQLGLQPGHPLTLLDLTGNQLGQGIPTELGNLVNLAILYLGDNALTGSIPSSLGDLGQLRFLSLGQNELTGNIPESMATLEALTYLNLTDNHLTGSIPVWLGNFEDLEELYLSQNRLEGPIPSTFGALTNLTKLSLSNNQLRGLVPTEFTNLTNLAWLGLHYNALRAEDPGLLAFLEEKSPNWQSWQTVPPTAVQASPVDATSVRLTWEGAGYLWFGHYEVSFSTVPGGVWQVAGTTASKHATTYTLQGLQQGTTYVLRLRTFTAAHEDQQNDLWSDPSEVVTATTWPAVFLPLTLQGSAAP